MCEWASRYIGIPYLYLGDTEKGADCWGLVRLILRNEYKINLPQFYHSETRNVYRIQQSIKENVGSSTTPALQNYQAGDIILMQIRGVICHIGIYADGGYMLHTLVGHDSALEKVDGPKWINRIEGFYRAKS